MKFEESNKLEYLFKSITPITYYGLVDLCHCPQSFVVAVLAIVIATFSTGIDSKCFQVNYKLLVYLDFLTLCSQCISDRSLQLKKDNTPAAEDDVPYGYGFFHFVFATGAMYFAMLLIGWNSHHSMRKYGSPLLQ